MFAFSTGIPSQEKILNSLWERNRTTGKSKNFCQKTTIEGIPSSAIMIIQQCTTSNRVVTQTMVDISTRCAEEKKL